VPRDVALEHAEILDEQLEDALVALAPIYKLVAWSRQNDHIALDRRLEGIERERERAHAEAEAQTEKWRAEKAEAQKRSMELARARGEEAIRTPAAPFAPRSAGAQARKPSLSNLFKPGSKVEGGPGPAHGKREDKPEVERERRPAKAQPEQRTPPAPRAPAPAVALSTPTSIEKGTRVRVLSGAFADKVGLVGELDGRGGARVLLGLLSTRIEVANLVPVPEGRERPALQSSHRRPVAPKAR
jgi:hypothetical protein